MPLPPTKCDLVLLDTASYDLNVLLESLPQLLPEEVDLKRFTCELCKFNSGDKSSLLIHVQYVHDPKFFSYEMCERKTKTEDALRFHLKRSHGDTDLNATTYNLSLIHI